MARVAWVESFAAVRTAMPRGRVPAIMRTMRPRPDFSRVMASATTDSLLGSRGELLPWAGR